MFRTACLLPTVIMMLLSFPVFVPALESTIDTSQKALNGYDGCVGPDGTLYLARSEYYDLRLLTSTDDGQSWQLTDIDTPHDGKLIVRQVCVDRQSNIFILCQWYSGFPDTTTIPGVFLSDIYCITNITGEWTEELVIDHATYSSGYSTSYNSALPFDVYCDPNDNIRLFLYTFGWWSYGGTIHEKSRSAGPDGTWGSIKKISHIYTSSVDQPTRLFEQMVAFPDGGAIVAANNPESYYNYYLNRPLAGPWGGINNFASTPSYHQNYGGSLNLDIDEQGHVYCLYVNPESTLNLVKDWGEPEVVQQLTNPDYRINACTVDAKANGEAVVVYRIYDYIQKEYISRALVKTRNSSGIWTDPEPFADLLESTDFVGGWARFDMYHGGHFQGPLKWYGTAASSYPLPIFFYEMGEAQTVSKPDFDLKWLNPGLIAGPGEIPKIEISLTPKYGFDQQVAFDIREATDYRYAFSPQSVTPPANVALMLSKTTVEGPTSSVHNLTIQASSSDGNLSHELPVSYKVVRPSENMAVLTLSSNRNRIRLGDRTLISSRLIPAFSGEPVTFEITSSDEPGGADQTVLLTSNELGRATYSFAPAETGTFQIQASWPGRDSWVARESDEIQLEVIPQNSRASIRITGSYDLREGDQLAYVCRVSPAPISESATAEIYVEHALVDNVPSVTESIVVPVVSGIHSGSVNLLEGGLMSIRCRWSGEPGQSEGSESPCIWLYVQPEPVLASQAFDPINDPGACVIISGATSSNLPVDTRDYMANLAYGVFNQRRFNDGRLIYASDNSKQDIDWDGVPDNVVDIVDSSVSAVWQAMDQASAIVEGATPVTLFIFADKAQETEIMMNDGSILDASALNAKISEEFGDEKDIRIIVEASSSGEFCRGLRGANRTVICSAESEQASYFSDGLLSFSQLYLSNVQQGRSVEESFKSARDYLSAALGYFGVQTPVLYTGGDYSPTYLFHGISSDAEDILAPDIVSIFEPVIIEETREADILTRVFDDTAVDTVQGLIKKPDGSTEIIPMQESAGEEGFFGATLDDSILDQTGLYEVTVTATDQAKNSAKPATSEISVIDRRDINRDSQYDEKDLMLLLSELDNELTYYDIFLDNQLDYLDILLWSTVWWK